MSQDTATLHQGLECRGNLISTEAHSETGSTLVTSPGPRDSIRQCSYGWHVQQVCCVGTNVAHMTHAIARPRKCFLNAPNRMLGCHTISDIGARCFMTGSGALLLRFTSNLACDSGDLPETCNETPLFLHDRRASWAHGRKGRSLSRAMLYASRGSRSKLSCAKRNYHGITSAEVQHPTPVRPD